MIQDQIKQVVLDTLCQISIVKKQNIANIDNFTFQQNIMQETREIDVSLTTKEELDALYKNITQNKEAKEEDHSAE